MKEEEAKEMEEKAQKDIEKTTVEFRMPMGTSVHVEKEWLFVLGMSKFPRVIDVTQMSTSSGEILQRLLIGRRRQPPLRVSLNETAEICHVAQELKFKNLLKLVEKEMLRTECKSMRNAVDSLCLAIRFGMEEAAAKLVDEIVFGGFLSEELLMYCKSSKAVDRIMDRNAALFAEQQQQPPANPPPSEVYDFSGIPDSVEIPAEHLAVQAAHQAAPHRIMMNVAKERIRGLLNKPINSVKTGFAWISRKARLPNQNPQRQHHLNGRHLNLNPRNQRHLNQNDEEEWEDYSQFQFL